MKQLLNTIAILALFLPTLGHATEASTHRNRIVYLGAGLGTSSLKLPENDSSGNDREREVATNIYLGYQFHPNVAVELGASGGDSFFSAGDYSTTYLDAVGNYPIASRARVLGSLGVASVTSNYHPLLSSENKEESDIAAKIGTGVEFDLLKDTLIGVSFRLKGDYYAAKSSIFEGVGSLVLKY